MLKTSWKCKANLIINNKFGHRMQSILLIKLFGGCLSTYFLNSSKELFKSRPATGGSKARVGCTCVKKGSKQDFYPSPVLDGIGEKVWLSR